MAAQSELTPIPRAIVTDEIVKRLVDYILNQQLKPGHRLPSERKLMAQLSVGRSSLREAVKTLSAVGMVEVAIGSGMYVGRGETACLARPLSWRLLMSEHSTREVLETRRIIEVEMAGLAAERASASEVVVIEQHLSAMMAATANAEAYSQHDMEFHISVARAAHNHLLFQMLDTLRHILRVLILEVIYGYEKEPKSVPEHLPICRAILASDAEGARQAMAAHLKGVEERLWAVIGSSRPTEQAAP